MWKPILTGLLVVALAACNLNTNPSEAALPTATEFAFPTETTPLGLTTTPLPPPVQQPTLTQQTSGGLQPPPLPSGPPPIVTSIPSPSGGTPAFAPAAQTGQNCRVYTTYSGSDPANKISLRSEPRTSAQQLLKLPNYAQVFLVPGSQEVEADGFHWLNIIYIDPFGERYEGWSARDAYILGGTRQPSIATLRDTGQQAPC